MDSLLEVGATSVRAGIHATALASSGSRFAETMLTAIESCRQQQRHVFEYVTAAVQAHMAHQPTPSLLPGV